jgi:hypothetical protein
MAAPAQANDPAARMNFEKLFGYVHWSQGDPNGIIAAPVGALCMNLNGGAGTTLWVKESDPGERTGWVAK